MGKFFKPLIYGIFFFKISFNSVSVVKQIQPILKQLLHLLINKGLRG